MKLTTVAVAAIGLVLAGLADAREYVSIAHRGITDGDFQENSLSSLEETIRRGYTHIEVDLRCTKDGHAVVLHDRSLRRTTGASGNIDEITLAELRELVDEETVPSFETYCATAAGRIGFMPDIKSVPDELKDAFLSSLESSMEKHGLLEDAYCIGRLDLKEHFLAKGPRISMNVSVEEAQELKAVNAALGENYYIFGHADDFTEEKVKALQALGLKVVVSVNTFHYHQSEYVEKGLADVEKLAEWGVDGLQIDSVYEAAVPERYLK
jgi:glycerophosphoryl diester phosphodiesterase